LQDAKKLVDLTSDHICAIKVNFHLIIPLSLSELSELNDFANERNLVSIADIKLNDIENTNRIATEYLWDTGFSGVIVNPFVGFEGGLDLVYQRAREIGKGVISLAYMSHPGANEGYGLKLMDGRLIFELMIDRANSWGSDGVILGTTRPDKIQIARKRLKPEIKIFSPGSGVQAGNARAALEAGADYIILGRSILSSRDPKAAVREASRALLS
jgi:orotidine-5'-phosphate decarboxylase